MYRWYLVLFYFLFTSFHICAQSGAVNDNSSYITTAVPFLLVAPDARTSAMGGAGSATLLQNGITKLNWARSAFLDEKMGFAISYMPWLNKLTKDRKLISLDGFLKINERNTLGASLKYLSYGQFELSGTDQSVNGILTPNELAINMSFSRKLSPEFSLSTTLAFIRSSLYSATTNSAQLNSGNDIAVDVSLFYNNEVYLFNSLGRFGLALCIENIGPKMSYENQANSSFYLPSNLRLGSSLTFIDDNNNQITFALDLSKLLVPSSSTAYFATESNTNQKSVLKGIITSFSDARNGFREELQEIQLATGFEYSIKNKFALRAGYSYQNPKKGNNSYFSCGFGAKHKNLGFDIAYLTGDINVNSFSNTLRLTLAYNIGK
ncbi:type IX secretion system outer membrane channel protein PorV [Pedobacter steynii]